MDPDYESSPTFVETPTSDHLEKAQSMELHPSLSQTSSPISSGHSDTTDFSLNLPDATLFPDSLFYTDVQVYSKSAYLNATDSSVRRESFYNGLPNDRVRYQSYLMPVAATSYAPITSSGEEVMFMSPRDVMSQAWDSGNNQSGSAVPSSFPKDNTWSVLSAPNYIASSQSQINNGTSTALRISCISIEASAAYQHVPEVTELYSPTAPGGRTEESEIGPLSIDNEPHPRSHALYQNVTTHQDGLYHCPWEGKDPNCNHKPEKLKCNYDKFVDSHLKPYRCKVQDCENARFSSIACLLRHEREAHAMHGHGEKPFFCTFEGCERSQPGNGFPRHWNLSDHMKRAHNRSPSPYSESTKPATGPRKRKMETSKSGSRRQHYSLFR